MSSAWKLVLCQIPLTLNRQPQKGQRTQGCRREDCMMDTRKTLNGCGGQGKKRADKPREDEGTNWSKLKGMGMMGEWMEWNIVKHRGKIDYQFSIECLLGGLKCPTMLWG
jgi:hypothetical protein